MGQGYKPMKQGLRRLFWPPSRVAGVLVYAALIWRIARWAYGFPLWGDEAFVAVNFLTRGYPEMVEGLDHAQVVPLGFLWSVLAISSKLGPSEQVLRLLPTLAGLASLLLLWRWAPRALPRRQACLGIAIFAASYYPARHANEVKPYAVDLFVALVLTVLAWWCWQRVRDPKRWAVLAPACALGIWFSYPSAFVTAGTLLALLGRVITDREARRSVVPWVGGVVTAGLFLFNGVWMWRVFGANQSVANESLRFSNHWSLAFPPGPGDSAGQWLMWPVRWMGWFFEVHTGNMLAYPLGGKNAASTLTFILVAVGCYALWRRRHPLLPLLLMPAVVCLAAASVRLYPYGSSARTTQFLAPAVCLLAGVGGVALAQRYLGPREAVRALRLAAFVLLLIIVGVAARDVIEPYKHASDLRGKQAAQDLAADASSGDRWVVVGAMHDTPWAPNMIGWGGTAARTRHYLIREARRQGLRIDFAPDPDSLVPGAGQTVLIVYRDNKHDVNTPFPAEQIGRYRALAEARLGTPVLTQEVPINGEQETLWYYHYAQADNAADPR